MKIEEYFSKINSLKREKTDTQWISLEVNFYSSAGRILESLKKYIKNGLNFNKHVVLNDFSLLLKDLCELSIQTGESNSFRNLDWERMKPVVPGGAIGCTTCIINMIRTSNVSSKINYMSRAANHIGLSFDEIAITSLSDLNI